MEDDPDVDSLHDDCDVPDVERPEGTPQAMRRDETHVPPHTDSIQPQKEPSGHPDALSPVNRRIKDYRDS